MLLHLHQLPVRLSEENAQAWKEWFFEHTAHDEVLSLAKALAPIASKFRGKEKQISDTSTRSALSDFLNGHSDVVVRWIGDKPNHYGRALAHLVDESTETLAANYLQYISADFKPARISEQALDYLPLTLKKPGDAASFLGSSPFEPVHKWLDKQNRPALFPESLNQPGLSWQELIEGLKALSHNLQQSELATDATFRLLITGQRLQQTLTCELAEQRLQNEFTDDPIFALRETDTAIIVSIELAPLTLSAIDDWLSMLKERHYLNADEAQRVYQSLKTFGEQTINRLRPQELLYALQDFRHSLFAGDPAHIYRKQAQWLRLSLQENSKTAMGSRWLEVGTRKAFFLRWIKEADHLHGSSGRVASRDCFHFESPSKDAPDLEEIKKVLQQTLHIEALEELKEVQAHLFSLIPGTHDPEWEGFIERTKEGKYQLTADLRELGYAELISTLTPEDLDSLPANFENSHIMESALQIASLSTLSAWCKTLLKLPDNKWLLLFGALLGLSQRADLSEFSDSPLIIQCWWRLLTTMRSNVEQEDLPHIERSMLRISQGLCDLLPIFRSKEDLSDELRTHFDDELSQEDLASKILPQIARHIRFQLSWELAETLEPTLDQHSTLLIHHKLSPYWLHLAEKGELSAKQKLLSRPDLQSPDFDRESSLPLLKRLQWSLELIEYALNPIFIESDLIEGIEKYEKSDDEAIRQTLKNLLAHKKLLPRLSSELSSLLKSLKSAEETIQWLLDPLHDLPEQEPSRDNPHSWRHKSPVDQLISILKITGDKELARSIATLDLKSLPQPDDLSLFTGDLSPARTRLGTPNLRFIRLEKFARLRHLALLLLADWGDLPEDFQHPWQIDAPQIASERTRVHRLLAAIRNKEDLPEIDDERWQTVLDELCFGRLESIREEPAFLFSYNFDALEQNDLAIIAMTALKPHQRWQSLSLFTHQIWKIRHKHLDSLLDSLPTPYLESPALHIWSEPEEYLRERREWAQKYDPSSIQAWCENPHLYRQQDLLDDLPGLAKRAWPYLNADQKTQLLRSLERGPLDKTWWSRGMELPLKERLYFARSHGILRQRRQIAQDLLNKYDDDPTEFLRIYFSTLLPEERPPHDQIQDKVDAFIELFRKDADPEEQKIPSRIIQTTTSPQQLLNIFPSFVQLVLQKAIADHNISAKNQGYLSKLYDEARKRVELNARAYQDFQSRLDNAKKQLRLTIERLPDSEHRTELRGQLDDLFRKLLK